MKVAMALIPQWLVTQRWEVAVVVPGVATAAVVVVGAAVPTEAMAEPALLAKALMLATLTAITRRAGQVEQVEQAQLEALFQV
jgi:hypothetical protein